MTAKHKIVSPMTHRGKNVCFGQGETRGIASLPSGRPSGALKRHRIFFCALPVAALLFFSCKKEQVTVSDTPDISIVSVSPGTVKELKDSIVFRITYRDGDGDLGENNPNVENLFVQDNRINQVEGFRIPQLAPSGSDISIEGDLVVEFPSTGITDGSSSQSFNFTIWVKDRSGHESNRVITPNVTVTK